MRAAPGPVVPGHTTNIVLRLVALALLAVTFVYLAGFIERHWRELATFDWSQVRVGWIALAAFAYGASLVTTAMAWPAILTGFGQRLETRRALGIGLTAQIGKYVPGNFAHFVGRAALAKRAAVPFRQTGVSTVIEFSSAIFAAALVGAAALLLSGTSIAPQAFDLSFAQWVAASVAMLLVVAGAAVGVKWLVQTTVSPVLWIRPVAWLAASFVLAGISMSLVIGGTGTDAQWSLLEPIGFYALAWTAGFVLPGAPAGLGVREAVLVGTLAGSVGAPTAIVAAAAHRLLTALVDGIGAITGTALLLTCKETAANA